MIPKKVQEILKKQHYKLVGEHSAVQICRWTKKSLRDEGVCYKEQFYGIKSHLCCQMSPAVMWCPNKCIHCWRAIELTIGKELNGKINTPKEIIESCINAQRKLLQGFNIDEKSRKKQLSKANQKKYLEAQEPMQFAISLSGEPTLYPYIGELIEELRKRGKTSFLVTNGLYPEKLLELKNKKQLPTQLYISVNTPNKEMYDKFSRSSEENAWEKLNKSLEIMSKLKCRTVFRMNLIKNLNMDKKDIDDYIKLIKKAKPKFIEVKGYMSVGYARKRLGYDRMPTSEELMEFVKELVEKLGQNYKLQDFSERSRAYVISKNKKDLKIRNI